MTNNRNERQKVTQSEGGLEKRLENHRITIPRLGPGNKWICPQKGQSPTLIAPNGKQANFSTGEWITKFQKNEITHSNKKEQTTGFATKEMNFASLILSKTSLSQNSTN